MLGHHAAPVAVDLVFESGRFFLSARTKSNLLCLSTVSDVYQRPNIGGELFVVVEQEKQCNAERSSLVPLVMCGHKSTKARIVRFDSVQLVETTLFF